jgi:prevent-host-death family protein
VDDGGQQRADRARRVRLALPGQRNASGAGLTGLGADEIHQATPELGGGYGVRGALFGSIHSVANCTENNRTPVSTGVAMVDRVPTATGVARRSTLAKVHGDHYNLTMATKGKSSKGVPAGEFKAKCLRLMDQVAKTRQPLTVTKRGKPVVRIVPVEEEVIELFGCLSHRFEISGDIEAPILPAALWGGLE